MMRPIYYLSAVAILLLIFPEPPANAQRGGRGGGGRGGGGGGFSGGGSQRGGGGGFDGGGMQRGGGDGLRGGNMQRGEAGGFGGGLGGGLSSRSSANGSQRGSEGMGPYGREGTTARGSQFSGGWASGVGARPGAGAGGAGGPASGVGARPGAGAGGTGGPASGIGSRPGAGAGGAGGPASGVGARPGAGAGGTGGPASGIGVAPGAGAGGAGGPGSGIGVRPGAGAGGVGADRHTVGTYYTPSAVHAEQGAVFRRNTVGYQDYSAAMYQNYANAWTPTHVVTSSLYTHPGYSSLAVGLGLSKQPVLYDYGGNVVVHPQAVYVNGDSMGTPQQYASQASQLARGGESAKPVEDTKWLPLGVFAVVEGDQTSSDDIFQLAVDRQGIIRGNYHNVRTDQVESISGAVEKTSQRAAWTIGSDQYPVYEAGVANLTKDETSLLVHTGDGQSRQLSLIRLPQPSR